MYLTVKLKVVTFASIISLLSGVMVLIGWISGNLFLQTIIPAAASMKFNTAVAFILLGTALLLTQFRISRFHRLVYLFLSLSLVALATLSVLQTFFTFNSVLDELFVNDIASVAHHLPNPGRMSANTAICFVFLGSALTGFSFKKRFTDLLSQYLLNFVTAVAAVALIGYLYGFSAFYRVSYTGSMTLLTAFLLFLISLAASLLHPTLGITRLFTGNQLGNTIARRLFFIAVFIVVMFGLLRLESDQLGFFPFKTGVAILIICFLCIGLAVLAYTVNWLNALDASRHQAEHDLALLNKDLEKRVRNRSASLLKLLDKFRASETKFKAAFEHSAIGIALVSLKGKWLQVNKRLCEMVGYKEQELLSMSFEDVTHPDDKIKSSGMAEMLSQAVSNTGKFEKRYICKDGTPVWVCINIATVTNKKGGAAYFVSQFEDITERKNAEVRLKAAYDEIKKHIGQIQEMAWKQSHLIRSPLANLKGLTDLLMENPADNEMLHYVRMEVDRMDKVIIEMAEDVVGRSCKQISVKRRSFHALNKSA